jgi:hypothetical protein
MTLEVAIKLAVCYWVICVATICLLKKILP